MSDSKSAFYVTGGTLRPDAPSYIARQADAELFQRLAEGGFCYVLTSRQMGKSSLMVRTASRLREAGHKVVVIDLTAFGQNLTAEQWYEAILGRIGRQFDLEDEFEDFWDDHRSMGPLVRLMAAIHDLLLKPDISKGSDPAAEEVVGEPKRLILFFDEIDVVRSLPFSSDEFFIAIRECYNRRATEPEFSRLSFCLLGIASPSDLIRDPKITPFQIGHRIELSDFTDTEARAFIAGLGRPQEQASGILNRILYWTNGHPYLTQVLCHAVVQNPSLSGPVGVDRLCDRHFLSAQGREEDDNLMFVREWLVRSPHPKSEVLGLFWKIHLGRTVPRDPSDPLQEVLRLSGITRTERSELRVRNRIYHRVFERGWMLLEYPGLGRHLRRRRAMGRALQLVGSMVVLSGAFFAANRVINSSKKALFSLQATGVGPSADHPVPARPAGAGVEQIDLTRVYNTFLTPGWDPDSPGDDLGELPPGLHQLGGVLFDVRGVVRCLPRQGSGPPVFESPEIKLGITIDSFHFLHATDRWKLNSNRNVGAYHVTYSDGQRWEIPLDYLVHFRDWRESDTAGASAIPLRGLAWVGKRKLSRGNAPRLFLATWDNPRPKAVVRSVRLVSESETPSPFLVALTIKANSFEQVR